MEKVFTGEKPFDAINQARSYAYNCGYSVGSMCGDMPMALKKGDWNIAKWRNLTGVERLDIEGHITGEMRNGPVKVTIFENDND